MESSLTTLLFALAALANERQLTYTYDSLVLPLDVREVEVWTTLLPMADGMLDMHERLEFEFPVGERLTSALYVNASAGMHETSFDGISSEWKWNVLSRHVAPVGLALYGEAGIGPSETELEAKLILDREAGPVLVAYNLVGEVELEREMDGSAVEIVTEYVVENDLGVAWKPTPRVSVGAELRNHTEIPATEGFEHSAFFVGPTVAYASPAWWAAASVLPQVYAIRDAPGLEMVEHTALEVRLLLGMHL
jgi:hypothetical protein